MPVTWIRKKTMSLQTNPTADNIIDREYPISHQSWGARVVTEVNSSSGVWFEQTEYLITGRRSNSQKDFIYYLLPLFFFRVSKPARSRKDAHPENAISQENLRLRLLRGMVIMAAREFSIACFRLPVIYTQT